METHKNRHNLAFIVVEIVSVFMSDCHSTLEHRCLTSVFVVLEHAMKGAVLRYCYCRNKPHEQIRLILLHSNESKRSYPAHSLKHSEIWHLFSARHKILCTTLIYCNITLSLTIVDL